MPDNKYAAADCGSNSFHLIVLRVRQDGSFEITAREREIVRLAKYKNNIIPSEAIERSIETLKRFKKTAELFAAPLTVAATSAVRNASNKEEFLKKVFENTGINVRVLSGEEEADLTFKGVSKSLFFTNSVLCIDIGGGSTEFIIGQGDHIHFRKSLELGAVKLCTKFFNDDYSYTEEQFLTCYNYTLKQISELKTEVTKYNFELTVGASGTIISAASIASHGSTDLNNYRLKRGQVKLIYEILSSAATVNERKVIKGVEPERADIIPAGLIILQTIFEVFGLKEMVISTFGLREGMIIDAFLKDA